MLSPKDPIAKKHPDWLLKTPAGKTVVETNVWLDPANPQVQAYLLGNMEDILKEKDLAGIQLDDHWAVPRVFGNKSQALTNLTRKLHDHVKAWWVGHKFLDGVILNNGIHYLCRGSNITVEEHIKQVISMLGENIKVRRFIRYVLGELDNS